MFCFCFFIQKKTYIAIDQYRFHYNKHTTWWEAWGRGRDIWDMSTPSSQFCCEAKTLKKSSFFSKKKQTQNLLKDTELSHFCNSRHHYVGRMTRTVGVSSQIPERPGSLLQNWVHSVQINLISAQHQSELTTTPFRRPEAVSYFSHRDARVLPEVKAF